MAAVRAGALLLAAVATLAATGVAPAASAGTKPKPRVTLIGDSIAASFDYVVSARRHLARGLDLRSEAVVCRRLVAPSCVFQGSQPSTALQSIQAQGVTLGRVVIVNVGYNDWAAVYDVDRVMRALVAAGVRTVVWVTLRETTTNYAQINGAIRRASRRWQQLVVADWNAFSSGRPWFRSDGLHLNVEGATGLSRLLRPLVLAGLDR